MATLTPPQQYGRKTNHILSDHKAISGGPQSGVQHKTNHPTPAPLQIEEWDENLPETKLHSTWNIVIPRHI
jgi:hypothetical protein